MKGARRELKAQHKIVLFFKKRNLQKESLKKTGEAASNHQSPTESGQGRGWS